MHHILYISTAVGLPCEEVLKSILAKSRQNNEAKNITGVLLYSEGTFIQLLEGLEADIQDLYNNLLFDHRHKNQICLINAPAQSRVFPDWRMGFKKITDTQLSELNGQLNNPTKDLLHVTDEQSGVLILKTFIQHNLYGLS